MQFNTVNIVIYSVPVPTMCMQINCSWFGRRGFKRADCVHAAAPCGGHIGGRARGRGAGGTTGGERGLPGRRHPFRSCFSFSFSYKFTSYRTGNYLYFVKLWKV